MRYTELLESQGEKLTAILQRDCQPFLQAIGNDAHKYRMYRGISSESKSFKKMKVRLDDRRPNATDQVKHDQVNDYFTRAFGEPFRHSAFVSGNRDQAKAYGYPHIIFPIGDFTFLWASDVNDMAITLAGKWPSPGGFQIPPKQEYTDKLLARYDYKTSDLTAAIESRQEIMIRCNEYYAIDERLFSDTFR